MAPINRLLLIGLLSSGIGAATTAQAGNQLFEASWSVKSFGNECSIAASGASPGPYCGNGAWESSLYSAFGIPHGIQCNPNQPRCPFESTPTDGAGGWAPLGGHLEYALYCAPWFDWQGYGTSVRPAKGNTVYYTGTNGGKIPPLYRNPAFFTSGGQPNTTFCTATSTGATPGGKGLVQAGQPIAGKWGAVTTGTPGIGGFTFAAAPAGAAGLRTTEQVGEFAAIYPYVYSYTYATLRNRTGWFGPGNGPGDFSVKKYQLATNTIARMRVKQGAAKFGGTMTMLGALTTKVCYYRNGGCSLIEPNWRYDAIGTPAQTSNGVVTNGYIVTWHEYGCWWYGPTSCLTVEGSRFPWTTGSATVTAVGRGPHRTVHYAKGYDNRTLTSGKGTIQLVSPVLTRWLQPAVNFETGGIAILRIKFVPEPHTWVMLIVGASLLCVGVRMRKH
ncbi:MAG: hypothetical protein JRE57_15075 [Deltaproteobacteria bacterium]|nr:hypothetical protein [Deltaproteobacteria bacterium]